MHINPVSGMLTWAPTDRDRGTRQVTVRADDGNGSFDTQTFDLDVTICDPLPREFNPYVEDRIASIATSPPAILATPVVADWNGDGYPDIIVPSYGENLSAFSLGGFILTGSGRIHVISGKDHSELILPFDGVDPTVAASVGDLDGDGRPDAVISTLIPNSPLFLGNGYPIAVRNDGSILWENKNLHLAVSTTSLVDINGDGEAEVLFGSYLLNGQTGEVLWHGDGGTETNPAGKRVRADIDRGQSGPDRRHGGDRRQYRVPIGWIGVLDRGCRRWVRRRRELRQRPASRNRARHRGPALSVVA